MRTEVKIGLVICVLIVGIVIATSLFNKDEDAAAASNTDGPKHPAAAQKQPGTTNLRVPRKAPDPARPARAIPKTSTAARNTTPPASMRPRYSTPQTVPYKPTTPATPGTPATPAAPAPAAKIQSGTTGGNAVDFSALKPGATGNTNLKPLPGANTLAPVKISPPPANTQLPSLNSAINRPATTPATPNTPVTYIVTKDDTGGFYGISKKLYGSPRYAYLIRNANPDAESTRLRLGQKLRIPPIPDQARRTESPATSSGGKIHVVADGEVAWDLAKKYYGAGKYLYLIERANRSINLNNLQIGQKLIIPNMPKTTSATTNNGSGSVQVNAAGKRIHTIAANDILGEISKKYYGTSRLWPAIKRANPGLDENYLIVGKKITIPTKAEALKLLGITEAELEALKSYVRPKTETTQTATSTERGQYKDPKPMFD